MIHIADLPGDGIGPEVTAEAVACLKLLSAERSLGLRFTKHDFGGAAIDRQGDPLPASTLDRLSRTRINGELIQLEADRGPGAGARTRPRSTSSSYQDRPRRGGAAPPCRGRRCAAITSDDHNGLQEELTRGARQGAGDG